MTSTARDLVSYKLVHGSVESSFCCCVRVSELVRCFPEALSLVEGLDDEAASENSNASKWTLGATHFDNALFSAAVEHEGPLYIEAPEAYRRDQKQNTTFTCLVF